MAGRSATLSAHKGPVQARAQGGRLGTGCKRRLGNAACLVDGSEPSHHRPRLSRTTPSWVGQDRREQGCVAWAERVGRLVERISACRFGAKLTIGSPLRSGSGSTSMYPNASTRGDVGITQDVRLKFQGFRHRR